MTQWYENNPELLELEKQMMGRSFPQFKLEKLDDERLYWIGTINTDIGEEYRYKENEYTFMMVYSPVYPSHSAGCPLKTYLIKPETKDIVADIGFFPLTLLKDSAREKYIDFCDYNDQYYCHCVRACHQAILMSQYMLCIELHKNGLLSRSNIEKAHYKHGVNNEGIPHWQNLHPDLFEKEKKAVLSEFPDFKCETLPDGRVAWYGLIDEVPVIMEYDKHHPHYNFRKSISTYIEWSESMQLYGFSKFSFEKEDNPLGLSAHLSWTNNDKIKVFIWRTHDLNNPNLYNALYELRLFKIWHLLCKARTVNLGNKESIEWNAIVQRFPDIEQQIENILYGKI